LTSNEVIFTDNLKMSDWLNGWQGHLKAYLPIDEYRLSQPFAQAKFRKENFTISKWWAKHHIPHFLRFLFPVVWSNNKIVHEFLTGCDRKDLKNGDKCLQIELNYSISK
jgi:tRNA(Ile)-lysidine synthase